MDNYSRLVIDLYKEIITQHQVNSDRILEVQTKLANAITSAKVLGKPFDDIVTLKADVDFLSYNLA